MAALPEDFDSCHPLTNNIRELNCEDTTENMLLNIERGMPSESASVHTQAKSPINVYEGSTDQSEWKESRHAARSNKIVQYIKKFDSKTYAKGNTTFTNSASHNKKLKRKQPPHLVELPELKRKASEERTFRYGSAYEIDQQNLPANAPPDLKSIHKAIITDSTKEFVTIRFPSIASLNNCFGEFEKTCREKARTRCLLSQNTVPSEKPELDKEFLMTQETAKKVLRYPIPSSDYLQNSHNKTFWLPLNMDMEREDRALLVDKVQTDADHAQCDNDDEQGLPSTVDKQIKKALHSQSKAPALGYSHKKTKHDNTLNVWRDDKFSDLGQVSRHQDHKNKDNEKMGNEYPAQDLDAPNSSVETCNRYNVLRTHTEKSLLFKASEKDHGMVKWGIKKKATSQNRYRGNSLGLQRNAHDAKKAYGQKQVKPSKLDNHGIIRETPSGIRKGSILKVPKEMQCRWSCERYKAAQLKLLQIMHDKGAIPGKPLLRPALREEARKHIGDTGLLDHLLKHMTNTVISNGQRFRRRHNSEGAMEYWLEDARLMDIRKQAGVEPYWVPPSGWKIGDVITENQNGQTSAIHLIELKQIKEDVESMKRQLEVLCAHIKAHVSEPVGCLSWQKFENDVSKHAQEMKMELHKLRELVEPNRNCSQRSPRHWIPPETVTKAKEWTMDESYNDPVGIAFELLKIGRHGMINNFEEADRDKEDSTEACPYCEGTQEGATHEGDASPDSTKYESPEDEAEEEDMAIIASKAEYKAKIENTITVEAHVAEGGCKGRSDNISFFYKATHRSFSHEERRKRQTASRL